MNNPKPIQLTNVLPTVLRFTNGVNIDVHLSTFLDAELYRSIVMEPANRGIRTRINDSLITRVPEWTHGQADDSAGSRGYHFRRLLKEAK